MVPAPYFFGVQQDSGKVYVKSDLRSDKGFTYIVSTVFCHDGTFMHGHRRQKRELQIKIIYSGSLLCGILLRGIACYVDHDFMSILLHLCYILSWLCESMAMWNKFSMPEHIQNNRSPL